MGGARPKRKRAKDGNEAVAASSAKDAADGADAPLNGGMDDAGEQDVTKGGSDLAIRLREHATFFDNLIRRIPPRFYLPQGADEEIASVSKYTQNHGGKAPKQAVKEASKKAKRAKLDPKQAKDALEIQAERRNEEKAASAGDDALAAARKRLGVQAPPTGPSASREELLARIHDLIQKRRGNRKVGAERPVKQSKKDKAKEKERKNLVHVPSQSRLPSSVAAAAAQQNNGGKKGKSQEVMFSKFDLGKLEKKEAAATGKNKKKGPMTAKQMLQKVEASQERLQRIEAADPEKAKAMKKADLWNKALAKASGEKVIDDVGLIKKTIKRQEKQKVKTKRQWKSRVGEVEKAKKERVQKRESNLQKRIDAKKAKRIGKKGSVKKRPGFEGGGTAKKTHKRR